MAILLSFIILTMFKILLGVDNIVYLAILSQKLPKYQQKYAMQIGLTYCMIVSFGTLDNQTRHPFILPI